MHICVFSDHIKIFASERGAPPFLARSLDCIADFNYNKANTSKFHLVSPFSWVHHCVGSNALYILQYLVQWSKYAQPLCFLGAVSLESLKPRYIHTPTKIHKNLSITFLS